MSDLVLDARHRAATRRAVRVDCQVVREHDFRLIALRSIDLSTDGMLIRTEAPVDIDDELIVALRLPNGRSWIDAEARVSRIVRGMRKTDGGRGIALRFSDMDRISEILLEASLRGLPPPVPRRKIRKDYARTVMDIGRGSGLGLL